MEQQPLVSVIMANYNHAQYINQAVESVENQTYHNIELIIVDDGSTDESHERLKEFKKRGHKVILNKENKGKWHALNTGIEQAKGKLITTQDADDASTTQRLEWQVSCLFENQSFHNLCGFEHCYSQEEVDDHQKFFVEENSIEFSKVMLHGEVTNLVLKGWKTPGINHYFLGDYEAHGASSLFFKQHWDFGMKFLPGNLGLRCQRAEDSDFNTKMTLLLQRTSIIKQPFYVYRRNTSTNPAYLEEL